MSEQAAKNLLRTHIIRGDITANGPAPLLGKVVPNAVPAQSVINLQAQSPALQPDIADLQLENTKLKLENTEPKKQA
jgi:hypothetical protein